MVQENILWKDGDISFYDSFILVATLTLLLLTPLIPLAFFKFSKISHIIVLIYAINGSIFYFIAIYLYYDKKKWLYFNQNGIVIRWHPETKGDHYVFGWHHIKRINVLSSWKPKNFMKWKKIKKTLSLGIFFTSAIYSNMLILELKDDRIFFIGVNDFEGMIKNLDIAKDRNEYLAEIPIMNYGKNW